MGIAGVELRQEEKSMLRNAENVRESVHHRAEVPGSMF